MFDSVQRFISGKVTKYVFEKTNDICIESVLYQYQNRTVLCISTQCGCYVGCLWCGTGKHFKRSLLCNEIVGQVYHITKEIEINDRFQIMFMSMGEPFLNYIEVKDSIINLHKHFPKAELLISTIGPDSLDLYFDDFTRVSMKNDKIGLQYSVHSMDDEERNILIPYRYKQQVAGIIYTSKMWSKATGRPVYFNFIVNDQNKEKLVSGIKTQLTGLENYINLTFSVECPLNKQSYIPFDYKIYDYIQRELPTFNIRMFDPDGQDDIGSGCGQLWYVQDWFRNNSIKTAI